VEKETMGGLEQNKAQHPRDDCIQERTIKRSDINQRKEQKQKPQKKKEHRLAYSPDANSAYVILPQIGTFTWTIDPWTHSRIFASFLHPSDMLVNVNCHG
jgi:hypothetical protein